jgi:uncharacterized membrane protein YphA (DoxX/SURF4 family)
MRSTQDILLLFGRAALGVPFIFVGFRQVEAWPDVVGLFRHAGGPYPFVLGLLTVAANLLAPTLFILGSGRGSQRLFWPLLPRPGYIFCIG